MTREEAKVYGEKLIKVIDSLCDNYKSDLDDEDEKLYEFLKVAVEALEENTYELVMRAYKHGKADGYQQGITELKLEYKKGYKDGLDQGWKNAFHFHTGR